MRPTQCVGGLYLMVADSLAPLPFNNNNNNTYHSYLLKLMRLHNKAIRIVTCSGWNDSAFPLLKKTNVLTIPLLFQYETAKLVHRHNSNDLPVNLSNYFTLSKNIYSTRFTTNENLQTPLFRLQRTQKSIKFTGAKIWNSIPSNIRKF